MFTKFTPPRLVAKLFIGLSLSLLATIAYSANWIYLTTSTDDAEYYYDKSSVKVKRLRDGTPYLQVWEKYEKEKPSQDTVYTTKSLSYYDCWNDKTTTTQLITYNYKGAVLKSQNYPANTQSSTNWDFVIPDTVGETMFKKVCSTHRLLLRRGN